MNHRWTVLGVDIGTTSMKMGVYRKEQSELALMAEFSRGYEINTYNGGLYGDIEPSKWQDAFVAGCRELDQWTREVDAIALSGTTPGLTAIGKSGEALYPAILMLDQRSRKQAQLIIDTIGLARLLETTANMPVAGGCSLASILWIKENEPEVFRRTAIFGHSNTFMTGWLTGVPAIDPSSASLTALYNTVKNDLSWNEEIAGAFGLSLERFPRLMQAWESPGRVRPSLARELGLNKEPPVVVGGNDAVLAAFSAGIQEAGEVINVNGTCEISLVCLPRCYPSCNYNTRVHVVEERWLTLYVMNAGGEALEWFRELFCNEMTADAFYGEFMNYAVERWLGRTSEVTYVPFLMGSRYSLEPRKAAFTGLTRQSSREELLAGLVKGLCEYQREHLKEIALEVPLKETIYVTGGAATPAVLEAKRRWMRDCRYQFIEQSSMKGAALLGLKHLTQ